MQVKKQQLDMKQWTGFKLGKEYVKTVCCHLVYLTSMQRGERGSGAGGRGPGVWTKPAEAAVDEAATVAVRVFGSGRADERR